MSILPSNFFISSFPNFTVPQDFVIPGRGRGSGIREAIQKTEFPFSGD
jgi:hypothetical protein